MPCCASCAHAAGRMSRSCSAGRCHPAITKHSSSSGSGGSSRRATSSWSTSSASCSRSSRPERSRATSAPRAGLIDMRPLLSCLLLAGCLADAATPDPAVDESNDQAARVDPVPVAVPGELQLHADGAPSTAAMPASCTYIQWCNKPHSPERIVCVLRPSCIDTCNTQQGRDSVVAACQNDAEYLCGTTSSITYHGCNGLGP